MSDPAPIQPSPGDTCAAAPLCPAPGPERGSALPRHCLGLMLPGAGVKKVPQRIPAEDEPLVAHGSQTALLSQGPSLAKPAAGGRSPCPCAAAAFVHPGSDSPVLPARAECRRGELWAGPPGLLSSAA